MFSSSTPPAATFARRTALFAATTLLLTLPVTVVAETGFYAGASVGVAALEAVARGDGFSQAFDNEDFSYKFFGGFNFDVPLLDFGVEGSYLDLGAVSASVPGPGGPVTSELDARGWSAFGVVAADVGPLALFGKLGLVRTQLDVDTRTSLVDPVFEDTSQSLFPGADDSTDLAAGVGARFGLGPVQVRGEVEYFDIEALDSSWLFSAGVAWQF